MVHFDTYQLELRLQFCYNLHMSKDCNTNNRILWLILTFFQMSFIFFMSSRDAAHSSLDSLGVTRWICNIFVSDWNNLSAVNQAQIIENIHGWIRMCAHFTEFAVLGLLLFLCVRYFLTGKIKAKHVAILSWAFGTIYAVTDEIHQYFVPGRACEITDVVVDSAGVICGIIIALIIKLGTDRQRLKFFK